MATRICRWCSVEKDFSEFVKSRSGRFGITWCCVECGRTRYRALSGKPKQKSKWLSIKRINLNGYSGAAVYKLSFDNGQLFYIGSTLCAKKKPSKWVKIFKKNRQNRKMKTMIQDKSCATFEIIERVDDVTKLFEREEYHIQSRFNSPFILNISMYANGRVEDSWRGKMKPVHHFRDGILLSTYPSISSAAKATGIRASTIWRICSKTINPKKYNFSFANPTDEVVKVRKKKNIPVFTEEEKMNMVYLYHNIGVHPIAKQYSVNRKFIRAILYEKGIVVSTTGASKKRIVQYTKRGEKVKEFDSINEATRELGAHRNNISDVLNGRAKSWHGFHFRLA